MESELKYAQVMEALKEHIRKHCVVGSKIPPTVTLEKEFGVSRGTINRAMRELVSDGRLERLRGKGTFVANSAADIGFLWPNSSTAWSETPYAIPVLHGVEEQARNQKRRLLVRAVGNSDSLGFLGKDVRGVGGVIIIFNTDRLVIERFHQYEIPVVIVDPLLRTSGVPFVTSDHFAATYQMTLHLARLGHKRIAHVTPASSITTIPIFERIHGYNEAMREAGLEQWRYVHHTSSTQATSAHPESWNGSGDQQAEAFIEAIREHRITACCCYDDLVACWVIRACHSHGVNVPRDVSVGGVNDTALATHIWPPLTTMHLNTEELGRRAVQLLTDLIDRHCLTGIGETLPVRLVERASTRARSHDGFDEQAAFPSIPEFGN